MMSQLIFCFLLTNSLGVFSRFLFLSKDISIKHGPWQFFHKNRGFQCIRDTLVSLRQGTFQLLDIILDKWDVLIKFRFCFHLLNLVFFFFLLLFFLLLFSFLINFDFLFSFKVCLVMSVWSFDRLQKTFCDLEITQTINWTQLIFHQP